MTIEKNKMTMAELEKIENALVIFEWLEIF